MLFLLPPGGQREEAGLIKFPPHVSSVFYDSLSCVRFRLLSFWIHTLHCYRFTEPSCSGAVARSSPVANNYLHVIAGGAEVTQFRPLGRGYHLCRRGRLGVWLSPPSWLPRSTNRTLPVERKRTETSSGCFDLTLLKLLNFLVSSFQTCESKDRTDRSGKAAGGGSGKKQELVLKP